MSSTRGQAKATDDFSTPGWCTRALFRRLGLPTTTPILDPCAGDGAILRVARDLGHECGAIELRPECFDALNGDGLSTDEVFIGDALGTAYYGHVSDGHAVAVVTNPPYSLAREFVDRWAHGRVCAAFLLRLNFLGSQKRAAWWREKMPSLVLVLPKRPSFTGGPTDSCEYAWIVYGPPPTPMPGDWGALVRPCRLEILDIEGL